MKNLIFVTALAIILDLSSGKIFAQWRGGEGLGRVGTGLRDAPGANAGVWYSTGLLDWIVVEGMAKDRAKKKGHPQLWQAYMVRFMPEPLPLNPIPNTQPPGGPPIQVPPPVQVAPPMPQQIPPQPQPNPEFDFKFWAPQNGIYKPGQETDKNEALSDNGKYRNPYREIRFVKMYYRGPTSLNSVRAAVIAALGECHQKDITFPKSDDKNFEVSPSKDIGPNRKTVFAWGDDITKEFGFVVVDRVENGRIYCILSSGQERVAVADSKNFYDWYLGSYKGVVSEDRPGGSGSGLAVVPEGKRNKFVSIQLWMHKGDIATRFTIRDFQDK